MGLGRIPAPAALAATLALAGIPASAGAAVRANTAALQAALKAQGLYPGAIDGVAGPGTRAAVAGFQRRAGLVADGVAGRRTRRALGRRGRPRWGSRILRAGMSGWDVAALQFLLTRRGFPGGPVDGGFGPRVTGAVMRLQRHAGLLADGIVGPATRRVLRQAPPAVPLRLVRPVAAGLGDRYGPRSSGFHAGVDFPAPTGTPVVAPAGGRVVMAGWAGAWGQIVLLEHVGGLRTLMAHLSVVGVRVGQVVGAGQLVGRVGSTGRSTGPHLHFETIVRGATVDPAPAIG